MPVQSKLLTSKLRSLGRTLIAAEFSRRLATAVAISVVLLASLVILDGLFELSLDTRKALLTIASIVAGAFLLRTLFTPISQRRDTEELALLSEKHNPKFDSRLISSIQFAIGKASNPTANEAIVSSMVNDTEDIARSHNFIDAVDWRRLGRALLVLLCIGAVAITGFFAWHRVTPTLLKRVFLQNIDIPRDTQIVSATGDLNKVGIGDQIKIEATAAGKLPDAGTLRVRFASGRRLDYPLTKSDSTYSTDIEDVPESFTYQIRLNDARSKSYQVTAYARPEIESISATQVYPEYTGIEQTEHKPGDFYLFPASRFTLRVTATKPLAEGSLRLIGLEQEIPINPADGTASFEVPTERLTGFSITMVDEDGMEGKDPAVYRAELLGDEPPQVRITYPTRSEDLVTKTARSLIAFEATDRFGIATVKLNFQVNDTEPQSIELDIPKAEDDKPPTSLKNQYDWELAKIEPPLKVGDLLEYWITAQDLQKVTPGIGESEHLRLRVVSVAEKRQDLLSRASDYLGGVGATTEDQQRLNADLGDIIRAKAKQE